MFKTLVNLSRKKPTNLCCKDLQDKFIPSVSSDSENPPGEILISWDHHLGKYCYMSSLFNSCILHIHQSLLEKGSWNCWLRWFYVIV